MWRAHLKAREGRFARVEIALGNLEKLSRKELRTVDHSVLWLLLTHRTTERNEVYSCEQYCRKKRLFAERPVSSNGSAAQRKARNARHILCNGWEGCPSEAWAKI